MVPLLVSVTVGAALMVIAFLVSRRIKHAPPQATIKPDGYQEATITIKGGYHPDRLRVVQGVPLRLNFVRLEDDSCSERVIFSGVEVDRRLPAFHETTVEFTPEALGTYLFTCQWGMYRGKLIVTDGIGKARWTMLNHRFFSTPLFMALLVWLCTVPVLLLIAPLYVSWEVTGYLLGALLVGALLACWLICAFPSKGIHLRGVKENDKDKVHEHSN